MKRYLLVDSGVCQCSKIAESIEQEAGGKLTIRSLREPEVREMLDRKRPGWKWEPLLVEETDDKVRVYAGRAMSRRLLFLLGPRRAWKLISLLGSMKQPVQSVDFGRRAFFRKGATFLAVGALFPGIMKSIWQSDADLSGKDKKLSQASLFAQITPASEIDGDVKRRVRKSVASDPAFQYMYQVSTGVRRLVIPRIAKNLEIVGYDKRIDAYLIRYKFLPDAITEDQIGHKAGVEKIGTKSGHPNYHVLALAYSTTEKRSLRIVEGYGREYDDYVELYSRSADSSMVVRAPKDHPSEAQVISHTPRRIQENVAQAVGYDYENDPSLTFYRKDKMGSLAVQGNCEWICDAVFVLVCATLPPPFDVICGLVMVWECHEVCDPVCVGEGCP